MELGAFSVSLTVKDIRVSQLFYEKLGFHVFGGNADQQWVIMKNGSCIIGLFQGMFEKNMLTFNPGWNQEAETLEMFTDVRELRRELHASGVAIEHESEEQATGPASFMVTDPDGNPILIDQHV